MPYQKINKDKPDQAISEYKNFKTIYTDWNQFSQIPEDPPLAKSKIKKAAPSTRLQTKAERNQPPPPSTLVRKPIVKPKRIVIPQNYLRSRRKLFEDMPPYQLTDADIIFVKGCSKRFMHEGMSVLTLDLLSHSMIYMYGMERRFSNSLPFRTWMTQFFNSCYPQLKQFSFYHRLRRLLYSYWISRRNQYQFPIYRGNWHLGEIPLQGTDKSVRCYPVEEIRKHRIGKKMYQSIASDMQKQFGQLNLLCKKIATREQLKLQKFKQSVKYIAQTVSDLGYPELEEIQMQQLPKDIFIDLYTPKDEKNPKLIHRFKQSKSNNLKKHNSKQKKSLLNLKTSQQVPVTIEFLKKITPTQQYQTERLIESQKQFDINIQMKSYTRKKQKNIRQANGDCIKFNNE